MKNEVDFRKHGVNYDYIITLAKRQDGTLERVDYPINCLDSLYDKLLKMVNDDEFYDVIDMEKAILREVETKPLNICIPHEYNCVYINGSYDGDSNLLKYERIDQKELKASYDSKWKYFYSDSKRRLKRNNPLLSKKELESQTETLAEGKYCKFIHEEKINFLRKRTGFLQAYAYKCTYDDIEDVFFVSSERIGWPNHKEKGNPTWIYEINNDIKVAFWSNFCYGASSAFHIKIWYKGIMLCPYSEFVTYRYVRVTDILNYTRKYQLFRDSWEDAANFVLDFCNKAIADPDNFIKKEMTYEIKMLVKELESIVESKESYLKEKFQTRNIVNSRYSHVVNLVSFDDLQMIDYEKNPKEYELLFRMEKISGALKFVESLEQFSSILKFVRRAIVKIEDLNSKIYPELSECIVPIREEVCKLKEEVDDLESQYDKLEKKVEKHYSKIEIIKNKYKDQEDKEKAESRYLKRHPEVMEIEENMSIIMTKLLSVKNIYKMRDKFLKKLEICKLGIENYGILDTDNP